MLPRYKITDHPHDSKKWAVYVLDGPMMGVLVDYHSVGFTEKGAEGKLSFHYNVLKNHLGVDVDATTVGNILVDIMEEADRLRSAWTWSSSA